jgi:hypothetical protein
MKTFALAALLVGLFGVAGAASAADTDSPTGTWKWSGKVGKKDTDFTARLEHKDGKVTGSVAGGKLDLKIEDGTFKDGELSFTASGEVKGEKVSVKCTGKVTGDTVKGTATVERKGKQKSEVWEAKREKTEKKKD